MTWYEEEVKNLKKKISEYTEVPETIFYGSSSIRLWESIYTDFKDYKPANLGFGGSTLAACVWFFDTLVVPLKPKRIIFYAGDNDLGDGRNPEEVVLFFRELMAIMKDRLGDIPFAFISIKPSLQRWNIHDKIDRTNQLIEAEMANHPTMAYIDIYSHMLDVVGYPDKELYQADGLHLSAHGYAIWKEVILKYLQSL